MNSNGGDLLIQPQDRPLYSDEICLIYKKDKILSCVSWGVNNDHLSARAKIAKSNKLFNEAILLSDYEPNIIISLTFWSSFTKIDLYNATPGYGQSKKEFRNLSLTILPKRNLLCLKFKEIFSQSSWRAELEISSDEKFEKIILNKKLNSLKFCPGLMINLRDNELQHLLEYKRLHLRARRIFDDNTLSEWTEGEAESIAVQTIN